MRQAAFVPSPWPRAASPPDLRRLAFTLAGGFSYWLLFLLVLEPGNIVAALPHGGLSVGPEMLRLAAASTMGAMITPVLLALARRNPVAGTRKWPNLARLAVSDFVLSSILVVAGCLLARPVLHEDQRPLLVALWQEVVGNGPLVGFSIAAFLTLAHLDGGQPHPATEARPDPAPAWLRTVPIRTRGQIELVDLDQVDWIEAQGNYLALHGSGSTWLLRETLTRFEAQIDPSRFARIHRRMLVAVSQVRGVASLGSGDATLRLADGTELRMSRSYRDTLARLPGSEM